MVRVPLLLLSLAVGFSPTSAFSPGSAAVRAVPGALLSPLSSPSAPRRRHVSLRANPSTTYVNSLSRPPPQDDGCPMTPYFGAAALTAFDVLLRRTFRSLGIAFPSSLAGCGFLLFALLAGDLFSPDPGYEIVGGKPVPIGERGRWGNKVYRLLDPGAVLLARWLPIFFVPSLVTLPLAEPLGGALEAAKVGIVVAGGFLFSLLTTSWCVAAVRPKGQKTASPPSKSAGGASPPPFSAGLLGLLVRLTALGGAADLLAGVVGAGLRAPARYVYLLCGTLASFVYGARLPPKITKALHPLVVCTLLSWTGVAALGKLTGSSFRATLAGYRTGSWTTGPGDLLLFLLGPAVISLALQMYGRRELVRQNAREVAAGVTGSAAGGLFGTAFLVRLLRMTGAPGVRLALLSRNITSPLAMAIAGMLGADVGMAVSFVVVSGLLGANFGASILDRCGIKDPVARGLGIGAAAHGLGTAAFTGEKDAFPFAAIAMALTASFSTVLVSIPAVRGALVRLALGA